MLDGEAATAWLSGPEALAMEERPDELLAADAAALLDAFPAAKAQLPHVRAAYRCGSSSSVVGLRLGLSIQSPALGTGG